jgi:hypothetical protein
MSPDIFPKYLEDPSLLYRVSYEELKTLVVQYPYCQNLRYLLLVKSKMEGNVDQDRNMKMAAAYSLDRTQLYLLLKKEVVENQKELEFLDINHVVSDEEHQELELPVLDFSNGLEAKEKKTKAVEFDLTSYTNFTIDDEEDEEDELEFPDEDDILIQRGYGTDNDNTDVIIQDEEEEENESEGLEFSTLDDIDETIIAGIVAPLSINTEEEKYEYDAYVDRHAPEEEETIEADIAIETEALAPVPSYSLPLIPPRIDLVVPEIEDKKETAIVITPLHLPLVPPSIDLSFTIVEEIVESKIELIPISLLLVPSSVDLNIIPVAVAVVPEIEDIAVIAPVLNLPLIPPLINMTALKIAIPQEIEKIIFTEEINIDFEAEDEDVLEDEQEGQDFAEEIDLSIQATLKRLAKEQEKELEQEEAEEEAEIFANIKEKILEEGFVAEEELPTIAPSEETTRPMSKASFGSWLGRTSSPKPAETNNEGEKVDSSNGKAKKKKKGKKKKKRNPIIDNEGSRLIKAIKARRKVQRKTKSKQMLVRKNKVMQFAEKSLKENEEIISETLAKILVIQGKKGRAEFMYRQLILKFPEKSSFFAAEIEKIQKLK